MEVGNHSLKVISAFNTVNNSYTMVKNGRFADDDRAWINLFRNHHTQIGTILFGKTAPQHDKINQMFIDAWNFCRKHNS